MSEAKRDCYGARQPGKPGYAAICVNLPDAKWVAKEVANWIRRGLIVEPCTSEEARDGMLKYIDAKGQTP